MKLKTKLNEMSGNKYRIYRQRVGTQVEVAKKVGNDPQTISRREREEIVVTPEAGAKIKAIARA